MFDELNKINTMKFLSSIKFMVGKIRRFVVREFVKPLDEFNTKQGGMIGVVNHNHKKREIPNLIQT